MPHPRCTFLLVVSLHFNREISQRKKQEGETERKREREATHTSPAS